jgi:hypothetical protein
METFLASIGFYQSPIRCSTMKHNREPDWPALMRPTTARAYLDGIVSAAKFDCLVAPNLDGRMIGGTLVYTRRSIDDWIERGDGARGSQTPER